MARKAGTIVQRTPDEVGDRVLRSGMITAQLEEYPSGWGGGGERKKVGWGTSSCQKALAAIWGEMEVVVGREKWTRCENR